MSKENIIKGMQYRLERGEWVSIPPLGYETVRVAKRSKYNYGTEVHINEKAKNIVIDMFESYASGKYSIVTLEEYLQKKYPGEIKAVHNLLQNKFYIGIMTFKGKEYPHKYPCFISKELFEKAQEIRSINTRHFLGGDLLNKNNKLWKRAPIKENESHRAKSIRKGQEHRVMQGEYISVPPLGYKRINTDKKKYKKEEIAKEVVIDPDTISIVKDIFNLYASGNYTFRKIMKYVEQTYQRKMNTKTIGGILKNKFYIGFITYRGLEYPHKYPQFIDINTFNICRKMLVRYNFYLAKEEREKLLALEEKNINPHDLSLNEQLLDYCKYPKSSTEIQEKFNIDLEELNTIIFELELDNKIKEVQPRIWQTI